MSTDPLDHLEPACGPLLELVNANVDESMLREIAEADYGMDAEAHLAGLRTLVRGAVPAPLPWEPKEVLELIRWSEPEDPNWRPGSSGERGHWMRLFACTHLVRCMAEPENDGLDAGEESTIIQLMESAVLLGEETAIAALRLLAWRLTTGSPDSWRSPCWPLAVLILGLELGRCGADTTRYLVEAVMTEEVLDGELFAYCTEAEKWLQLVRRTLLENAESTEVRDLARVLLCLPRS